MTWKRTMQERLGVTADGILGPRTYTALLRYMGASQDTARALGAHASEPIARFDIDENTGRFANFIGELAHESMNFNRLVENLNYSSFENLNRTWPSRFKTRIASQPYVRNPRGLANFVYAGRNGNSPDPAVGDGWNYRGRSLIQITGKSNYMRSQIGTGLMLVAEPDLAALPENAFLISAEWWQRHGLNELADQDLETQISGVINRGNRFKKAIGLDDRRAKKNKVRKLWR